eukprot:2954207-Rhodomonas_salina.1
MRRGRGVRSAVCSTVLVLTWGVRSDFGARDWSTHICTNAQRSRGRNTAAAAPRRTHNEESNATLLQASPARLFAPSVASSAAKAPARTQRAHSQHTAELIAVKVRGKGSYAAAVCAIATLPSSLSSVGFEFVGLA